MGPAKAGPVHHGPDTWSGYRLQPRNRPGPGHAGRKGLRPGEAGPGVRSVRRWGEKAVLWRSVETPMSPHAAFLETKRVTTILPRKAVSPQFCSHPPFPQTAFHSAWLCPHPTKKSVVRSRGHFYLAIYGPWPPCPKLLLPWAEEHVGAAVWLP